MLSPRQVLASPGDDNFIGAGEIVGLAVAVSCLGRLTGASGEPLEWAAYLLLGTVFPLLLLGLTRSRDYPSLIVRNKIRRVLAIVGAVCCALYLLKCRTRVGTYLGIGVLGLGLWLRRGPFSIATLVL